VVDHTQRGFCFSKVPIVVANSLMANPSGLE
jgi:hypothetical protein